MFSPDDKYDDIINLPHHESKVRPRMSMASRAAQFGAFDPLAGYDEAISETARLTDEKPEIDEYSKADINRNLIILEENIKEKPIVTISYFVKDDKKDGGAIIRFTGKVIKFDTADGFIVIEDRKIPINDILSVEGDLF